MKKISSPRNNFYGGLKNSPTSPHGESIPSPLFSDDFDLVEKKRYPVARKGTPPTQIKIKKQPSIFLDSSHFHDDEKKSTVTEPIQVIKRGVATTHHPSIFSHHHDQEAVTTSNYTSKYEAEKAKKKLLEKYEIPYKGLIHEKGGPLFEELSYKDSYEVFLSRHEQFQLRAKLMDKLTKLMAKAPKLNIPIPEDNCSLNNLEHICDLYDRHINLQVNCTYLKIGLKLVFWGIQLGGTYFLKFNMDGYANNQIKHLDKYDNLLIEITEKYFSQDGEGYFTLSVEQRFMIFLLIQTSIFVGAKIVAKRFGVDSETVTDSVDQFIDPFLEPLKSGNEKKKESSGSNPMNDIMGAVTGLFGGGGDGGGPNMGGIMNMVGNLMKNNVPPPSKSPDQSSPVSPKSASSPTSAIRRRTVFTRTPK